MSSTVLVTGAAGFIGRWVVHELIERGHDVWGLDDLSRGYRSNVAAFENDPAFEFIEGDVCDEATVDDVAEEADSCIHLAAEIDVQESIESPREHYETNVTGTHVLLEVCRRRDLRLCLVSTCMVYDTATASDPIDEDHSLQPASPYAGTKLAAENLAESYYHAYNLPVTLLRPFNTYGPYQRTGVVPTFVERDLRGESLKIFGDGTQTRDLLYATDCARFIVEAALSNDAVGQTLNAGSGNDIAINQLAKMIATGDTRIEHVEHHHPQSEVSKLMCDSTKAQELLGWTPQVDLPTGIGHVRDWVEDKIYNSE